MPRNFEKVLKYYSEKYIEEWSLYKQVNGLPNRCICSHVIDHSIYIKNDINGNILVVGNSCIDKFLVETNLFNEIKEYQVEHLIHREDGVVDVWEITFFMTDLNGQLYVRNVLKKESEIHHAWQIDFFYRKCNDCDRYKIPLNDPEWKKVCFEC